MGKITVQNIRVYAYHGCLNEERLIGSDYLVTVEIFTNLEKASTSDNLNDTIDYVFINNIVKEEMKISSNLLEHVAKRIISRVFNEINTAEKTVVAVSKINPPIGGDVEMVTVTLKEKRP